MPFPAISTRIIPLHDRGSKDAVCSGPKQVAVKFSPEGDPTLFRARSFNRQPVTFFQVLRLNVLADIILINYFEKARGRQRIFWKKSQAGMGKVDLLGRS
jgi:hypothetical protein